jgi:hypothetical protein
MIAHILRRIRPSHSQRKPLTGCSNLLRCPLSNRPTVTKLVRHLRRQQTSSRPVSIADTLASYQVLPGLRGQRTRLLTRPILNMRGNEPPQRVHVPSVTRQLHVMSPSSPAVARRGSTYQLLRVSHTCVARCGVAVGCGLLARWLSCALRVARCVLRVASTCRCALRGDSGGEGTTDMLEPVLQRRRRGRLYIAPLTCHASYSCTRLLRTPRLPGAYTCKCLCQRGGCVQL